MGYRRTNRNKSLQIYWRDQLANGRVCRRWSWLRAPSSNFIFLCQSRNSSEDTQHRSIFYWQADSVEHRIQVGYSNSFWLDWVNLMEILSFLLVHPMMFTSKTWKLPTLQQSTIIGPWKESPLSNLWWIASSNHHLQGCLWKIATSWFPGSPATFPTEWANSTRWMSFVNVDMPVLWHDIWLNDWLKRDIYHLQRSLQIIYLRRNVSKVPDLYSAHLFTFYPPSVQTESEFIYIQSNTSLVVDCAS